MKIQFFLAENKIKIQETIYGCKICQLEFLDKYSAPRHLIELHCDKTEMKCNTCSNRFLSIDDLRSHVHDYIFEYKKTMEKHICEICCKKFSQFSTYERHVRMHSHDPNINEKDRDNDIDLIECEYCEMKFVKKFMYKQHLVNHNKDVNFYCNICKKTCMTARNFALHRKTHEELYCDRCQRSFTKRFTFKAHMAVHEAQSQLDSDGVAAVNYQCFDCKKMFLTYQRAKVHMKSHQRRSCLCNICGKIFKSSTSLQSHLETHTDRKHECPQCDKVFQTTAGLGEHMSKHTNRYRYKCNECDRAYDVRARLVKHINIAHKNFRVQCHRCPMKFTSNESLKKHQITHTGIYPYKCAHCTNEYRNKFNLKVHSRKYHNVEL